MAYLCVMPKPDLTDREHAAVAALDASDPSPQPVPVLGSGYALNLGCSDFTHSGE
jgi:hypothetical protein